MQADPSTVPEWLVLGVLLGAGGSVLVAGLFVVADRLFPADQQARQVRDGGEERRRAELREYLQAIDEQFAENHFVEGQHVAFYLPKRDVAITFDARAYYRIDRSPTRPVLVEHEMPGVHLGARLPFETPEVSLGPDPEQSADPTLQAFAELGLRQTATLSEVKSAYRDRVKEVHPDHGGDEEEFKRVREAYTMAKQHAS
ncbi:MULTISPECIES: J domain-containing protein [Haloarcula]|uniref:Molecular chaperone n=1 Tax=Haloarcula pellucida TaxID=1427151 RepID=A0A830GJB1_9EURY|nr:MULTISPECIES: J domain-containing protein [Halomicroarcula]MBX0347036.1 J domain-containing protein [Halomicroarcula pellucida]MDS0277089.1 J domain-containing protein [Halomicroarcula sp. S1AR25-4]GGN86661.1 molecular chaperone [Halomicroarcula pellucida]